MFNEAGRYIGSGLELLNAQCDRSAYRGQATFYESGILYILRKHFGVSRKDFSAVSLPGTCSALRKLFEAYDDFADNTEQLPDLLTVERLPALEECFGLLIKNVSNANVTKDQKRAVFRVVRGERQRQYCLQKVYGEAKEVLSGNIAISWRQQAAGHLLALFPRVVGIQLALPESDIIEAERIFFEYAANLQLLDDMTDIDLDISKGRQNALRSCLAENSPENEMIGCLLKDMHNSSPSFNQLNQYAPKSVGRIQKTRQENFDRVKDVSGFNILNVLANPANTGLAMKFYGRISSYKQD